MQLEFKVFLNIFYNKNYINPQCMKFIVFAHALIPALGSLRQTSLCEQKQVYKISVQPSSFQHLWMMLQKKKIKLSNIFYQLQMHIKTSMFLYIPWKTISPIFMELNLHKKQIHASLCQQLTYSRNLFPTLERYQQLNVGESLMCGRTLPGC